MNTQQRDTNLDACRALVMIHIVCVIHVLLFFHIYNEWARSLLLFEMPAIFFISGAAQQLVKRERGFKETVINRLKRVIMPFYVFFVILYLWLIIMTLAGGGPGKFHIDVTSLTAAEILKTAVTGGCNHIPYYGYTWFISCYMIISCSLPLQVKLLKHVPAWLYLVFWALVTLMLTPLHFPAEIEIKNLPLYNFFYIAGYVYYRSKPTGWFYAVWAASAAFTVYGFADGFMMPMQDHKFPADIYFLIFGTAWMCTFLFLLRKVRLPYGRFLKIWNVRRYNIYLYQILTEYTIYCITLPFASFLGNELIHFVVCFLLAITFNTATSYVTFNIENYALDKITALFKRNRQRQSK